ncbi:sensor histidine kinase [Allosphingosinicella vermicomposti]|uniref:sensor histidine kinase n=1 Tax=Allosphingosinicella vermicomposti TaxID=614671 RepID=UPI00131A5B46|nr:histidine kinase [Allosphingosinicella vermicomposti]
MLITIGAGRTRLRLSLLLGLSFVALILAARLSAGIAPGADMLAGTLSLAAITIARRALADAAIRQAPAAARFIQPTALLGAALIQTVLDQKFGLLLGSLPGSEAPGSALWIFLTYLLFQALEAALPALSSRGRTVRRAQADAANAEAAMLRLQLNPHAIVNSLNAVTSLILSGQHPKAAAMADKLAQFLRLSLQMSKPFIPLGDELMMIEAFLQAESIRYGDRLDILIDCPDHLEEIDVPAALLQPLVENAVKHAMASGLGMVGLVIRAAEAGDRLLLSVETDVASGSTSFGMGLSNTQSRLATIYGDLASIDIGMDSEGYRGRISIPLTSGSK